MRHGIPRFGGTDHRKSLQIVELRLQQMCR
jgi:hypothetical protein